MTFQRHDNLIGVENSNNNQTREEIIEKPQSHVKYQKSHHIEDQEVNHVRDQIPSNLEDQKSIPLMNKKSNPVEDQKSNPVGDPNCTPQEEDEQSIIENSIKVNSLNDRFKEVHMPESLHIFPLPQLGKFYYTLYSSCKILLI